MTAERDLRQIIRMKNIIVIGGGSGAASALEHLKNYAIRITSACTPFDYGSHSRELRDSHGVLPPGDARRHLIARSPQSAFIRRLLSHRFTTNGLANKSLGNLMMLAACEITGGDQQGLDSMAEAFGVQGRILYTTIDNGHLCAELSDGETLVGEDKIDLRPHTDTRTIKRVFLNTRTFIQGDVHRAIVEADAVIFTPGDLYGSIIANTLVGGFTEAIAETKAKLINVTNIVTKANETRGFSASQYSRTLLSYIGRERFDVVLCNTGRIRDELQERYAAEDAFPVEVDMVELQQLTEKIVPEDLLQQSDIVRHDPIKLGRALMEAIHAD